MAQQMITELNTPNITNSELMKPVTISVSEKLIEAEYIFHKDQFKTIQAFRKFIVNPANFSVIYDYKNENKQCRSVRYHLQPTSKMLYAILQPKQSNWILKQFTKQLLSQNKKKKHKKHKSRKPNNRNNNPSLSYAPLKTVKARGYIDISRLMTAEIIPNKTQKNYINVYAHIDKMVGLQITNVIKSNIWVLDPNFVCNKTGEPLYCMIDKIDPDIESNRNYQWKMRDQLYTATDIYNLIQMQQNELPLNVISNVLKNEIQQNMNIIKSKLINNMGKIFDRKKPWQSTMTFINDKERNIREKKLTIRKVDYLKICMEAVDKDIKIIPILIFTKNGYSIDGLVRIRIDPGLDIGTSFKLNPGKTTIKPTGNHICVADMKVNCQLVSDETMFADFFDGWVCNYNNFTVGDPNAETVKYNQKSKDCQRLREENQKLREENQNYKDVFHKSESLNDPIVNKHLCDLRSDEKDNEVKQIDVFTAVINSNAKQLIEDEQKSIINDDVDVKLKSNMTFKLAQFVTNWNQKPQTQNRIHLQQLKICFVVNGINDEYFSKYSLNDFRKLLKEFRVPACAANELWKYFIVSGSDNDANDDIKEQIIIPQCLKTDDMISIHKYKDEMKNEDQNATSTLDPNAKSFRPTFALVTVPDNLELQDELMIYHAYMMNNESRS